MWTMQDNYDARSRNPFCSVTGLPKLPHETRIFRLADIEFEGCFDIGEQVVKDMAAELGYVPPEKYSELADLADEYEAAAADAANEIAKLKQRIDDLRAEQYELIRELGEDE